ncbi:hypothetical protein B0H14DRAFT_3449192 [Mycena olivaceomarginata]|nr:hypothetical protein B0H14DRAFT_3449192 [Mycena olivaceomarginata]
MIAARLRIVLALSTGLSSKHSARLCPLPRLSLRPWPIPDSSLNKLAFAKHNHVVDTYPPTARVRSGSALSKTFPVRPSRHTLQEQAHFPVVRTVPPPQPHLAIR